MTQEVDLRSLKRRLSPQILKIRGVTGLGVSGGKLRVYMSEDSEAVRRAVRAEVDAEQPGAAVAFEVTGRFRPL